MKKRKSIITIEKNNEFGCKIYVEETNGWLVLEHFKSREQVEKFLKDEKLIERLATKMIIKIKEESDARKKEKKKASISNPNDIKEIKK